MNLYKVNFAQLRLSHDNDFFFNRNLNYQVSVLPGTNQLKYERKKTYVPYIFSRQSTLDVTVEKLPGENKCIITNINVRDSIVKCTTKQLKH